MSQLEQEHQTPKDPPWNIQSAPNARSILAQSCAAMLARLKSLDPDDKLSFLLDTRPFHKELFSPFTPPGYAIYAGTYRGEPGTIMEKRNTAIYYKDIPGVAPKSATLKAENVAEAMQNLNGYIEKTFRSNHDPQTYLHHCMRIFGDFNMIHPYLDGNGHTIRLMITVLMDHRGIPICPTWNIHPRPYNHAIGICLQNYRHYPELLEQYLKIWFKA